MNYFLKSRYLTWILLALLLISFSALGMMVYQSYCHRKTGISGRVCPSSQQLLIEELNLTPSQSEAISKYKAYCRCSSQCMMKDLSAKRQRLMDELSVEYSDTLKLDSLAADIGAIHYPFDASQHQLLVEFGGLAGTGKNGLQKTKRHGFSPSKGVRRERIPSPSGRGEFKP